jgi:uncharacterized protein YkvS
MNCKDYQNLILESFGKNIIQEELEKHLQDCAECRKFKNELGTLSVKLGGDELFSLEQFEVEQMVKRVDAQIDDIETDKEFKSTPMWKYFVPVAAAIFLVLGIAFVGNIIQMFDSSGGVAENEFNEDTVIALIDINDIEDYSNISIEEFMPDFSNQNRDISDEALENDLTEDEYQYLVENFNIGEII